MKVVIFPLFQLPTGHSKVAEALEENILELQPGAAIKKVDLLSHCSPMIERFVSSFYMKMITRTPELYQKIYETFMFAGDYPCGRSRFNLSSLYFEHKMRELLRVEKPDLVVFTHSFPSSIYGRLVRKGSIAPVTAINAYTDFFLNDVWAKKEIDYHFVPHPEAKRLLAKHFDVDSDRIFVTGIPVKKAFLQRRERRSDSRHILIAGGNTGLFNVDCIASLLDHHPDLHFTLLCGHNKAYRKKIEARQFQNVTVKGYIRSCEEISRLYDSADAILTKPGGVTSAEALRKRLPMFICNYLSGQEKLNLDHLVSSGVAVDIVHEGLTDTAFLQPEKLQQISFRMDQYVAKLDQDISQPLKGIMQSELATAIPEVRPVQFPALPLL